MLDTGSEVNLIKISSIDPETLINVGEKIKLSGITEGCVETLGSVEINVLNNKIKFHVVQPSFPIETDGILGTAFYEGSADVLYTQECVVWHGNRIPFANKEMLRVPPRSNSGISIKIINKEVTEGLLPRINVAPGIYLGNAIVRNVNGRAIARIINTTNKEITIPIPIAALENVNIIETKDDPTRAILTMTSSNSSESITKSSVSHSKSTKSTGVNGESSRVEQILNLLRLSHLNNEEREEVVKLVDANSDLFYIPGDKLGKTDKIQHKIPMINNAPVHVKQYRYPHIHKQEINKQVDELLSNQIIKPSTSPYNSPLWIVPKKPDSKGNKRWRMVIDFRMLNEKSIADAYPLPNITEILDQLGSAKYFSVFDLASGFHQIGMHEADSAKTAFSTPYGHYEFTRMPFGLRNAPATFQRLMDSVLTGLQGTEMFVYLDDIVLYASSIREHEIKFKKLTQRLREANLRLQPDKCGFLHKEVTYLGHIISNNGVKPDPMKIRAVQKFPKPMKIRNIREFLGLAGYYRRFIPKFSNIAKPLTNLLKKDEPFVWSEDHDRAFCELKEILCSEPLLHYPDFAKQFNITTDASNYAIGGILSQGLPGQDPPIAYTSRLLTGAELNYSTIEKECLAIIYCVNYFRPYVYGREFQLITDHKPLVWMHSVRDPTSRLLRWRLKLAEYEYKIIYKTGKTNKNADALSRNPVQILPLQVDSDESLYNPQDTQDNLLNISYEIQNSENDPQCSLSPQQSNDQSQTTSSSPIPFDRSDAISTSSSQPNNMDDVPTSSSSPSLPSTTSDTSTEPLIDIDRQEYRQRQRQFIETRDKLTMRNDNLICFTDLKGNPVDTGAHELAAQGKLAKISDAILSRAKIRTMNKFNLIIIPIKNDQTATTDRKDVVEGLKSLLDVTRELQLQTISISKSCIDVIPWTFVRDTLTSIFFDSDIKIIICQGIVKIPHEDSRQNIITENHTSAFAGHKGVTKTYKRIRERYFWPNMKKDVQIFIQNCDSCQLKKLTRVKTRQPMTLTDTPGVAFDKISMDVVGPLPITPSGYSHILTIQDLLTKFFIAIPLKQTTAVDIADALINSFICKFGAPKAILTDQGSNFLNSLIRSVTKRFKITQCRTTAFHPQSNGSIERSHHVLSEYLKHFINQRQSWDQWLDMATFSYNTSVHEGTQFTPHELVYGRLARLPSSDPTPIDTNDETYAYYLRELNAKITEIQSKAKENLNDAKAKSKVYYDRKLNIQQFSAGDCVYLLKEPSRGKFSDQYTGPYVILETFDNRNVRLRINNRDKIVHSNKLKPCKKRQ